MTIFETLSTADSSCSTASRISYNLSKLFVYHFSYNVLLMCRLVIAFVRLIFAAYKSSIHVATHFFMLSVLVPQLIKSSSISLTQSLTVVIASFSLCNSYIRSFLFIRTHTTISIKYQ